MKKFLGALCASILLLSFPAKAGDVALSKDKQIECIAKGIYFEARDQSLEGKKAVAHVILNRTENKSFPDTACKVIYQKNQFSWTNKSYSIKNQSAFSEALRIADEVYHRTVDDITKGSLFFHNKRVNPKWKLKRTVRIDDHIFYKK